MKCAPGYDNGLAEWRPKPLSVGDTLELIHPSGNRQVKLERMFNLDGDPRKSPRQPRARTYSMDGLAEGALWRACCKVGRPTQQLLSTAQATSF